ncbi:hypothetical protein GCM10017714_22010 [Curtobacterium pusillum]|uniref:Bacterial Ig domain-containing protein n=1 Tax=Curtobacterium pusillum TaxID=69373 RepID=A0ABX2MC05_9MICO|nr:hypothetical protein [Curtobacterium pusillum]NUU14318.1 hypothetical protein [Curtobacterium pusillum]GLK32063.1 hypothetical protein GCM10017610_23480 [Curtobacterium pusillum]
MSNKKKRLAKGLGASVLAAATIASGLSFGASAASAAPQAKAGYTPFYGSAPTISSQGTGLFPDRPFGVKFWVSNYPSNPEAQGTFMVAVPAPSLEEARQSTLSFSSLGSEWSRWHVNNVDGCLFATGDGQSAGSQKFGVLYHYKKCDNNNAESPRQFRINEAGEIENRAYPKLRFTHIQEKDGINYLANSTGVQADLGGEFARNKLTAQGAFDADVTKKGMISGIAEKGATVVIKNGMNEAGRVTADATTGAYSIEVAAPDAAGTVNYTVSQIVNGTESGDVKVAMNYGSAVKVTSPADQSSAQPGQTTISGTGENGGKVEVKVNGQALPEQTVASGKWSVSAELRRGENTITAKQLSKGANTTTSTVTVNPGQSSLDPATVTTDEYVPGERTTFEGTATAGSTLRIQDTNGTDLLGRDVQTNAQGKWSFEYAPAADSTKFTFKTVQSLAGDTRTDGPFTVDAKPDAFSPVTVTRPETVTPGVENVFTGTATPNATYRVLNASGTQIVPGTFTIDANGNWTFNRVVSTGASKLDFIIEQTLNGETRKSQLFSIKANAGYAPITNATQSVRPGVQNTFTGTGPAGASYRVLNSAGNQIVDGSFKIDGNGNWTFDRLVSANATDFRFRLEVTTTDGAKFVSKVFTVQAEMLEPVTVSTTEVFPGIENTFSGTGHKGATYTVLNASGTVLDPSIISDFRVDSQGNWTFKRVVSNGATEFRFKIKQTLNGQSRTSELFTINAATFRPVTVENDGLNVGIWNTISGTATPGSTIRVLTGAGAELPKIKDLTIDAKGKWSFKRIASANANDVLAFKIEQSKDGKTSVSNMINLAAAEYADVTIDNATVIPGKPNTFTGKATPGAAFEVFTPSNVGDNALAAGTVNADGTFSFDRTVGTGATQYAFKVVLTKDGEQSVSKVFTIPASTK